VVVECKSVCARRSCTDAIGLARSSSGEQAGSLLSVINFTDRNAGSGLKRMPRSDALEIYLSLRDVVAIRTVILGNCCWNCDSRGISQRSAKLVGTLIRTIPDGWSIVSGLRNFFTAADSLEKAELTSPARSAPSSVRTT
jgi:sulfur relay (sulfurtransferase) complex TusBCD TusD component (DsrE family)